MPVHWLVERRKISEKMCPPDFFFFFFFFLNLLKPELNAFHLNRSIVLVPHLLDDVLFYNIADEKEHMFHHCSLKFECLSFEGLSPHFLDPKLCTPYSVYIISYPLYKAGPWVNTRQSGRRKCSLHAQSRVF